MTDNEMTVEILTPEQELFAGARSFLEMDTIKEFFKDISSGFTPISILQSVRKRSLLLQSLNVCPRLNTIHHKKSVGAFGHYNFWLVW